MKIPTIEDLRKQLTNPHNQPKFEVLPDDLKSFLDEQIITIQPIRRKSNG